MGMTHDRLNDNDKGILTTLNKQRMSNRGRKGKDVRSPCRYLAHTSTPKGRSKRNRGRRNAVTTPPVSRLSSLHPEGAQRRTHIRLSMNLKDSYMCLPVMPMRMPLRPFRVQNL